MRRSVLYGLAIAFVVLFALTAFTGLSTAAGDPGSVSVVKSFD